MQVMYRTYFRQVDGDAHNRPASPARCTYLESFIPFVFGQQALTVDLLHLLGAVSSVCLPLAR